MLETLISSGLQHGVYLLEAGLFLYVLWRGHARRLGSVFVFLGLLFSIDGVGRRYVLHYYGVSSPEYAYFFWVTDVVLALAAFLLVCALFRRATFQKAELWRHLRLLLAVVFLLVLGISSFSLLRNYNTLFTIFIVEFQQNLYFTCLVLNTLLYILLQQTDSADDELGLLVSGLGIQFAGPAANLALIYLTQGWPYAKTMLFYVNPLCTFGMLLLWSYAIAWAPKVAPAREVGEKVPRLAEVRVRRV